ncbi:hypothetical protein jhhlp_007779 [Lomentospora prolificans]|uniref:SET domain-containing protein n=1 Tax=Lomentospora prolificans TaxID=41688 RepID=A0A2N3N0J4_9PEZI|nr:hypothetical protein jhhlp_007779 [Lomentospora prolificans]
MTRLLSSLLLAAASQLAFNFVSADEGAQYKFEGNDAINNIVENTIPAANPNLPGGWYAPDECYGNYCVYASHRAGGGRGVAAVTTSASFEKLKRMDRALGIPVPNEKPALDPPPYEIKEVPGRGQVLVANTTIRRGTKLVVSQPVLIVHRKFMDDEEVDDEDQERLLDIAVKLLPGKTQKELLSRVDPNGEIKTLMDLIRSRPFEENLGLNWVGPEGFDNEKNIFTYPELAHVAHHCQPNAAFHIDQAYVHHTSAVRKILPGEEINIAYFSPLMQRAERQHLIENWLGKPCTCSRCTGHGDLGNVAKSDARLAEIEEIEKKLRDYESKGVTTGMLSRLQALYEEEGLNARYSDMYELLALNYNALGYQKRCIKYANLAVQAGIIEDGPDSNDVIAMRILAKNTLEHYSWKMRMKGN